MLKSLLSGNFQLQRKDELYLHESLRKSSSDAEFQDICKFLGNSGSLFCIPTLMAFAKDKDLNKATSAINALSRIQGRIHPKEQSEINKLFSPEFWQARWSGTNEKFISYVACIGGLIDSENFLDGPVLDEIAEKLIIEMHINLYPYESFQELKLCTSGWEAKEDFIQVLNEIHQDTLIQNIFSGGEISKSEDALFDENIINMRCDYLLTRLKLDIDYATFHYLLKVANRLNE